MESNGKHVEASEYERSHSDKIVCSKCGRVLISSHEGIVGDNNIAFCEYCYKVMLFPNFHEHSMEITD